MVPDLGGAILALALMAAFGVGVCAGAIATVVLFACGLTSWAIFIPPPVLGIAAAAFVWGNR